MISLWSDLKAAFTFKILAQKAFLIISVVFMFLITFETATARIPPPIIITGTIDLPLTTISKNVLVTVNLTNKGNLAGKGIDVQVYSPGFKVLSEKKWPDNIYPNSSVR
jgi:hypothetical protein